MQQAVLGLSLAAIVLLAAQDLFAQSESPARVDPVASLSLEQLLELDIDKVFTASRFIQDARRAPASVTIITSADIRRFGYRTLADALRSIVGFYSTYDRNYTYLGVRGFLRPGDYNDRILVLIDGHRSNDGVYDEAMVGTEFLLDLALVDRIEVVRGPSSSLYGSSAFLGVVNVITRRGGDVQGTEVAFESGTLGTLRSRVSVGARTRGGVDFLVSGTAYHSDGQARLYFPEFDTPSSNNGTVSNQDADAFRSLFGRMTYRDWTLEAGWISRNKKVPTAAFDTVFADPRFETTDGRMFATMQYGHRFDERTEIVGRVFFDAMQYRGTYPHQMTADTKLVDQSEDDSAASRGVGGELLYARRFLGRNNTTVGVELRDNYRLDQLTSVPDRPDLGFASRASAHRWAVFGQQEFSLSPAVLLSGGVRYDHDPAFGGSVNPRLGLTVTPSPSTTVKLLYGTAFRSPSAYELYYWPNQGSLQPETIRTSEVTWEQRLGPHVRTSMSAFRNVIDNLISISQQEPGGDNDLRYVNAGRASAHGLEWLVEGRWAHGVMARFGHTWDAADDRAGAELSNAPRHLTKLAFLVPLGSDRVTAGLQGEHVGQRLTIAGAQVSGFYRQDLTISATRIIGGLDARLSIGNLFDRRYGDPGAEEHRQTVIMQDGRTVAMSLGYRF